MAQVSRKTSDTLPRTRQGSPTSLLLTLFGDYWYERSEPLPSSAIVSLLGDFGVSEAASRAALSRMVKHRLLQPSRTGRNTGYRLTPRSAAVIDDGLSRITADDSAQRSWDGSWVVVVIDEGSLARSLRDAVRSRMSWLGFARLLDGFWLSPWDRHAAALEELRALGVDEVTTLLARVPADMPGKRRPEEAWNLVGLALEYRDFLAATAGLRAKLEAGGVDPVMALVHRTKLTDDWLDLGNSDPGLPAELLPPDWPRSHARAEFFETHEALGTRAIERVMDAIRAVDPDRAELVQRRSFLR